jgi:hypothetical protein
MSAVNDAIDRLQALHCESVIEPKDYEAIQLVVGELLDMRAVPTLHKRKCCCGNLAWHADRYVPYADCRQCGSRDTWQVEERKEMSR